jgi:legumain
MKILVFTALFLGLLCMASAENWAVLVAGSNTYSNYRHQADIYHAYQILLKNKFNPDRIITLAFDDIAHNLKNPYKGKVFNKPTNKNPGVDVYEGVKIDYTGKSVTP